MNLHIRVLGLGLGAIILVLVAVQSLALGSGYLVDIPTGLATRMKADEVAAAATAFLDRNTAVAQAAGGPITATRFEHIVAALPEDLAAVEPRAAGLVAQTTLSKDQVYWVVRAAGTFVTQRGRSLEPRVFASGYLVIDDLTGQVVGLGMP